LGLQVIIGNRLGANAIIEKLNSVMRSVLKLTEVNSRMAKFGAGFAALLKTGLAN